MPIISASSFLNFAHSLKLNLRKWCFNLWKFGQLFKVRVRVIDCKALLSNINKSIRPNLIGDYVLSWQYKVICI